MSVISVFAAFIIATMIRCGVLHASKDLWPSGSYSLPKPVSGCPKFWKEGWLKQDLENDAKSASTKFPSKFSFIFHMNASIFMKEFVERTFCTNVNDTSVTEVWPKGFYCIYKKQNCPKDMLEGSITWDDEDSNNRNDHGGTLPDLDTSFPGTKLYFCCQTQGKWYKPIELPTQKPFYLLPYSLNCQRVVGAISSLEYIIYDTEDNANIDKFNEHHVFTDEVQSLPKIYYCYYEGCQYKLQNDHGSFTSLNFPNNSYPDFQICSWSLAANIFSRISLKFLNLSIPNCKENYLDVYDGSSKNRSTLLARFCGENATTEAKVISKVNHLFIVLKSGNNSARHSEDSIKSLEFHAEYEAFLQVTTTSLPKPTNTTSLDDGRKDLQNADSENSAKYLSIILPIFAISILLGIVGTIFYWKRRSKENNAATPDIQMQDQATERCVSSKSLSSPVASKATTNPIYESEENAGYESNSKSATEMHTTTDNVLYEPSNELFEENPLYQATEYDDDLTYAKPNE